jgi:hypothetical protein
MLVIAGANFPAGSKVYADKANPGSLTTLANEWFIGTAITDTILLVNMNGIPLQPSGEVAPGVTFPAPLLANIQEGQTCAFDTGLLEWVQADPSNPSRLPTGFKGTAETVIMSGLYVPSSGNPNTFMTGIKQYAHPTSAGILTSTPNNWYVGLATAGDQLLVNMNSVAIPLNWSEEHDDDTGRHKFPKGDASARPSNPSIGTIVLRTDEDRNFIEYYNGTFWLTAAEETFASGTRMLFVQNVVPTGWTIDLTLNDRTVIITDTLAQGGSSSGSWAISGLVGGEHELAADELPIHRHSITFQGNTDDGGGSQPGGNDDGGLVTTDPTGQVGVGNNWNDDNSAETAEDPHAHPITQDGSWRPFNVAVIVCEKD